jgi:hypothetical protein
MSRDARLACGKQAAFSLVQERRKRLEAGRDRSDIIIRTG